ncbi:Protein RRP5 [Seminavis robusta]|uniref:Protein RRP5 n=1 Tax=Seminavis robusta TaxID=568900 RepID=A0A9N8DNR0_9STRA|nr:Protein RRP5 [Seminavis robusta]|eukprot:Sro264_g102530.1 Protein RRP5 (2059) ;mRNA; r:40163-46788
MPEDFPRGGRDQAFQQRKKHKEAEADLPFFVQKKRKKRALEEAADGIATNAAAIKDDTYLFGEKKKKPSKKKPKKNNDSTTTGTTGTVDSSNNNNNKHSLLPLGGGGVIYKKHHPTSKDKDKDSKKNTSNEKVEPFIEALGFSRLAKGTKLLGIVREVQEEFALVSLPNLLTGYVLRSETGKTAPPLTKTISVGQVLAVVILKTVTETTKKQHNNSNSNNNTRRRIQVSLEPSAVNPRHEEPAPKFPIRGKIQTLEDHGILVDLGHGRKGFLAFADMDDNSYVVKEEEDDDDEDNKNKDNNDSDEEEDGLTVLKVGQLLDFIVKKRSKSVADILPLKLPSPDVMAKQAIPLSSDSTPSIQSITPGWLVKAKVEALARNGLCVAFLGNVFRGAVELAHLGGFWIPTTKHADGSTDWKTLFQSNTPPILSFTARILAVDPATKMVRLSVLPHLMDMRPPPTAHLPNPGTVVQDATVIRLDPGVGALLALPVETKEDKMDLDEDKDADNSDDDAEEEGDEEEDNGAASLLHEPLSEQSIYKDATKVRAVYVHISKAMDDTEDGKIPEATFAKNFAPSTKHTVRILSTSNLVESVASGAAAESIINAHVLTHADLKPGKIFRKVPVCAHLNGGALLVEFGMEVRGLLTADHLLDQAGSAEYQSKLLKSKFAVGAKVDVRVLSSDPTTKRCFVTAKKSLLQATNIISEWDTCKPNSVATGFISRIDDRGLFVQFFGKVFGLVPAKSLALELGIDDHRANYKVRDVVQCRVVSVKKLRRVRKRRSRQAMDHDDEEDDEEDSSDHYMKQLTLSLRVNTGEDAKDDKQMQTDEEPSKSVKLRAGTLLPEKAMKVVSLVPGKERNNGTFVPGHAIVHVKSKYLVDEAESATMPPFVECKLPYHQLLDSYKPEEHDTAAAMDDLAERLLAPGKSLKMKGLLLSDARKTGSDQLAVVSIRAKLVENAEERAKTKDTEADCVVMPSPDFSLYEGARVLGFVNNIDQRYGAFVQFLGGLTGMVHKSKGGLDLELFSTVNARVVSIDTKSPPKIVLSVSEEYHKAKKTRRTTQKNDKHKFRRGAAVQEVEVESLDFYNANLKILDKAWDGVKVHARMHCTMAASEDFTPGSKTFKGKYTKATTITKYHPFHGWATGDKLRGLHVVSVHVKGDVYDVELTNKGKVKESQDDDDDEDDAGIVTSKKLMGQRVRRGHLPLGRKVSVIVKQVSHFNGGVCVELAPKLSGFVPGFECSTDAEILNNLASHIPVGARLSCTVIDKQRWHKRTSQATGSSRLVKVDHDDSSRVYLSMLSDKPSGISKPARGELVVGRIQRALKQINAPSLMLELRGGYVARCCISELEEMDEWTNMPLGSSAGRSHEGTDAAVVSGESDADGEEESSPSKDTRRSLLSDEPFANGKYVSCRVLESKSSLPLVDVSLRSSRIEGDLEDDDVPEEGEMCHAYVAVTNKSGCFVRVSRTVEGRVIIKELADDFLPNPAAIFPPGRLVVGKVKAVREATGKKQKRTTVDLDLRESSVLESEELQFEDVELQSKHKGIVTRVEDYGVFVRLNNSKVSGLVHKSECSDKYVKNASKFYDPGDLVKVLVIRKDEEDKKIGFSMKASHFADDEDSDDDTLEEAASDDDEEGDTEMPDAREALEVDSDDPDYASKLAKSLAGAKKEGSDDDSSSSGDDNQDDSSSSSESDDDDDAPAESKTSDAQMMDTDVGFDWSANASQLAKKRAADSDSESDEDDSEDDDALASSTSHKSRKKQAQKRREEQEISRRETALADGTADDNPETAADFERLLSGSPNSSEIWIRYMAFHLALVDIPAARAVAERAFARIEFSQEREKLNVWCALLALELKYGSPASFTSAIDRACQQNNPKQVYLRACEMLAKEVNASSPETVLRADEMFAKMCKKFKSKKQVWIAHLQYLLRGGRHKEAHDRLRRSLKSLPDYKHVETMSRFAQLEFEFGSAERARTIFDGVILKHPKRLDLAFVYADKEVKHGSMEMARALFEKIVNPQGGTPRKLSDKQMKSLFKKWYKLEEEHGTSDTQEHVKEAAKAFVSRS